jgi:hypothetical protein
MEPPSGIIVLLDGSRVVGFTMPDIIDRVRERIPMRKVSKLFVMILFAMAAAVSGVSTSRTASSGGDGDVCKNFDCYSVCRCAGYSMVYCSQLCLPG